MKKHIKFAIVLATVVLWILIAIISGSRKKTDLEKMSGYWVVNDMEDRRVIIQCLFMKMEPVRTVKEVKL